MLQRQRRRIASHVVLAFAEQHRDHERELVNPEQLRLVNGRFDLDAIRLIEQPFVAVQTSMGPEFDQAAIDAVRQWVYTPTLLNGVPVPVIMTVTVNFKLS